MRINLSNFKSWVVEAGGLSKIEVEVDQLKPNELLMFVERMAQQFSCLPTNQTHLVFSKPLTNEQSSALAAYIINAEYFLPFTKLTLCIEPSSLKSNEHTALINLLNKTAIKQLHLSTSINFNDEILEWLPRQLQYPVTISAPPPSYNKFVNHVMTTMHARNLSRPLHNNSALPAQDNQKEIEPIITDLSNKKIKLKELIKRVNVQDKSYDQHIKLEVQHIEVVQEQQQEVLELEVAVEEQQQQIIEKYNDELIGFKEFFGQPYLDLITNKQNYELVKNELFGNLPKAIKYLSPQAALVIAKHLPEFSTLNADNLPQNFIIKKTDKSELVLDYDIYSSEKKTNKFTPKEGPRYEVCPPIYDVTVPRELLNDWPGVNSEKQLDNLWIRYGNEGIELFSNVLKNCDQVHQHLSTFLFERYLKYFPHWDHLLDDKNFLNSLEKIKSYDKTKLDCLKKFLENTGSAQHNLKDTLEGFEIFWNEWEMLSLQYKVDLKMINTAWQTPRGGNPLVYMERLLTILKNARNLSEQIECLDGIILDNYGAYYASKYEAFKVVSKEMGFKYDPAIQDKLAFNQNLHIYHTELQYLHEILESDFPTSYRTYPAPLWINSDQDKIDETSLAELTKFNKVIPYNYEQNYDEQENNLPYKFYYYHHVSKTWNKSREWVKPEQFYEIAYRFLGQQQKSIPIKQFEKGLKKALDQFISGYNLNEVVLTALFFVAHDRYSDDVDCYNLMHTIRRLRTHTHVIYQANRELMKLYQKDVRLNPAEGMAISQRFGLMNSCEYESLKLPKGKSQYITNFFKYIENNKFAAYKVLKKYSEDTDSRWPFVFAIETAEYLARDVHIAKAYQDDLLLFSHLINSEYEEAYFEGRKDQYAEAIQSNLKRLKDYLAKAIAMVQPNNFVYMIKALLHTNKFFTYKQFLQACDEINNLREFDHKQVEAILTKHHFKLDAKKLEIFERNVPYLNDMMITLIMALNYVQKHGVVDSCFKNNPFEPDEVTEADLIAINEKISNYSNEANQQAQIKLSLQDLVAERDLLTKKYKEYQTWLIEKSALMQLNTTELRNQLQAAWQRNGVLLSTVGNLFLMPFLNRMKMQVINNEFLILPASLRDNVNLPEPAELTFADLMRTKTHALPDFADGSDFEKLERIATQASTLAKLFSQIMQRDNFKSQEKEFTDIFKPIDFKIFDYETLFALLKLLDSMPLRNYFGILKVFFNCSNIIANKNNRENLINIIQVLHNNYFPSSYIESVVTLAAKLPLSSVQLFVDALIPVFQRNQDDVLLKWIITDPTLSADILPQLAQLTQRSKHYREEIQKLLLKLQVGRPSQLEAFLREINGLTVEQLEKILEMIARSEVVTSIKTGGDQQIDYADLMREFKKLGEENIEKLYHFYKVTTVSIASLYHGLKKRDASEPFNVLLASFEKAPFGNRNKKAQFDITHVERVINRFIDLNHQQIYPYEYRKQMMEAFLFINDAGMSLPIYRNKPAMELSNKDIQELFLAIKNDAKEIAHLNPFQRRLYALGLMREAMYRATNQFPYSTQMIGLIDCIMHKGDLINNIDTGQGKSLIDPMKAALLWLNSNRVDLSTSSLADAKRDLEIYSPFMSLLGIPHAADPTTSRTPIEAYQTKGINFSTMSQLALFYAKAKGEGKQIGNPDDTVSLVMNESDYSTLDDRTIYRYASSSGAGVGIGNEWIYTAINEFVESPRFKENVTSEAQDIAALRKYLIIKARENKKSPKLINKFNDEQLLTWIESALIVNYRLREKFDYVITAEGEQKTINGKSLSSRITKILMKDGNVSNDTQYGNGMHQLLNDKLNTKFAGNSFVIEPESKTIISLNNRNIIDFYRSKRGFIWGSSGTVGYDKEIDNQYLKFGFEFSKVEPHQRKIVKTNKPLIEQDESAQFARLIQIIKKQHGKQKLPPGLVFCKDIETAERFYQKLQTELGGNACQLFTGLCNEEKAIENAAKNGMITITTQALGRNKDVHYDKKIGMTVYDTFVDSKRKFYQRGGRTGRQGSPGEIHVILNQQDFPGRSIEQVMTEVETVAEKEREYNESLYNVIGYFLNHVENRSKEFYRNVWAKFSDEIEAKYRQLKMDGIYQEDHFIAETVHYFNRISGHSLTKEQVVEYIHRVHPVLKKPISNQQLVAMKDCISSDIIAYNFINYEQDNVHPNIKTIKNNLHKIFAAIKENKFYDTSKQYIAYLNSGSATAEIKAAHQEFLTEFLTRQTEASKNRVFLTRWLGFEGHLNKIMSNKNYLLMFKALTDVRGEKISHDNMAAIIKQSVITLLNEYLQHSWFINNDKQKAAEKLIQELTNVTEVSDIINVIKFSKLDIAKNDIAENKNSFWRKIKPLHANGCSRLQATLDKALALTDSLIHRGVDTNLIKDLTDQFKSVVANSVMPETFISLDSFKVATQSIKYSDECNAKVLSRSIVSALKDKTYLEQHGMQGRFKLFPEIQSDKKSHDSQADDSRVESIDKSLGTAK